MHSTQEPNYQAIYVVDGIPPVTTEIEQFYAPTSHDAVLTTLKRAITYSRDTLGCPVREDTTTSVMALTDLLTGKSLDDELLSTKHPLIKPHPVHRRPSATVDLVTKMMLIHAEENEEPVGAK